MSTRQFRLPDLGEGLTEAEVLRWLVKVGDQVAVDQPVVEVETAKASVEVPSPYGGVVAQLHAAEGSTVDVGAPLISVVAGESSGNVLVGYGTAETRRPRRRLGTGVRGGAGSVAGGGAGADAGAGAGGGGDRVGVPPPLVVSPIVRKLARDHRVDLTTLTGTAPGGVIARRDVEGAISAARPVPPDRGAGSALADRGAASMPADHDAGSAFANPGAGSVSADRGAGVADVGVGSGLAGRDGVPAAWPAPAGSPERVPLRKAAVELFTRSRREIPDTTTWVDVDATALVALRRDLLERDPEHPVGILALLARFTVAGLARYPDLNSRVDTAAGELVRLPGVNLGIAAQGQRGLVVPVVRDAHRRNARELHTEIARLTEAARAGTVGAAELSGGTFTLNNYGVLKVDGATPIINHPQTALLGVGRILDRPWVVDGQVVPRKIAQFSLTFDHRICDGATAAAFLRFVVDCVERPGHALAVI